MSDASNAEALHGGSAVTGATVDRVKLNSLSATSNTRSYDSSVFVTAGSPKKTFGEELAVTAVPLTLQIAGEAPPLTETKVIPKDAR